MSSYKITVQATTEPVTLAEAKAQLRVDHTDEDTLINQYIKAARQHAERFTGLSLAAQTVQLVYTGSDLTIELPLSPVASIASVTDGTNALEYTSDLLAIPATVTLTTVPVGMVASYVTSPLVEADIKLAMMLLIHAMYDNRGMPEQVVIERIEEAYLRTHRVTKGMA